jgi:predicted nucleic acid-binding protein
MGQYLIDTNVVSDFLLASLPANGLQFMDNVIDAVPNLSVISQMELLCWKTDFAVEQQIKDFIADSVIFNITPKVIVNYVNIRRRYRIKTPDAVIAATAMVHGLTLVTNNERDFVNIMGLNIINPYNL